MNLIALFCFLCVSDEGNNNIYRYLSLRDFYLSKKAEDRNRAVHRYPGNNPGTDPG